ncbi:MAG: hypothetical protein IJT94_03985 [Oscillibacter sp.]|nr:hypothetical protein [Oscillibacter sp.]
MPAKLRSTKGASLIVALLLMIICSTVGSIILTAATANMGRMSQQTEYDQKYYSVVSAARLFADTLARRGGVELKITRQVTEYYEDDEEEPNIVETYNINQPPSLAEAGNKLAAVLHNELYNLYTEDGVSLENYWNGDFTNIGAGSAERVNTEDSSEDGGENLAEESVIPHTDFTISVTEENGADVGPIVYGRLSIEASRVRGDVSPGLDSVTHTLTAVLYSQQAVDGVIPEDAYVVRLVCPVYPVRSFSTVGIPDAESDTGEESGTEPEVEPDTEPEIEPDAESDTELEAGTETMSIAFQWKRDDMRIEQVRGVA